MNRAVKYGLILVAVSATIYCLLFLAFTYAPQNGIKFYPGYTMPFAALAPLFYAPFIARGMISDEKSPLNRREYIIFGLISVVGCAVLSFIIEAGILHSVLSQAQEISFYEIISSPMSKRYHMTVLFGMSFFVSATAVVAFVALVRVPANIHVRLRPAKVKATQE